MRGTQTDHDLYARDASTSSYFPRISAEQLAIKSRLVDLQGVEAINASLMRTSIRNDELDVTSRAIEAKRKAISRFVRRAHWDMGQSLIITHRRPIIMNPLRLLITARVSPPWILTKPQSCSVKHMRPKLSANKKRRPEGNAWARHPGGMKY